MILLLCCLYVSAALYAAEYDAGETVQQPDDSPSWYSENINGRTEFFQKIEWQEAEWAYRYECVVEDSSGKEIARVFTEQPYAEFSLPAGEYRYQITVYNLLDKPESVSRWQEFEIRQALQPRIDSFSPDRWYTDSDKEIRLTVQGEHLTEQTRVFLSDADGTGRYAGKIENVTKGNTEAGVLFEEIPETGLYTIGVQNPGGFAAESGKTFRVALSKPFDINISLGYAPSVILYDETLVSSFGGRFHPSGAQVRVSYLPVKKTYGYFGAELFSHWNMYAYDHGNYEISGQIFTIQLNFLYQKPLIEKKLILSARAGAGTSIFSGLRIYFGRDLFSPPFTSWYFSAGMGVSLQWFVHGHFFLEPGIDYTHIFAKNMAGGFFVPSLSAGWQF